MAMRDWVPLPSTWIQEGGLRSLQWTKAGADRAAALMVLLPIAHHADDEGLARCTYDVLSVATGLSRSKVANGLSILEEMNVIEREPLGRSTFRLTEFGVPGGWSKLPARRLYAAGRIIAFDHFKLRTMTELHALKLYYLFVRGRSSDTNMAHLSYDKIEQYAQIERERIRRAISFLASIGLVHVERTESLRNDRGTANAYRIAYLDPYIHFGTRGRNPEYAVAD